LDLTNRPETQITENRGYLPNLPQGLYPAWVASQQKEAGTEYAFSANGVANNPAQGLKLGLGEQGVKINGWEMGLSGVGYEGQAVSGVGSSQAGFPVANRLEYARGQGLREWYVNGSVGLEQGFTLEQPWPGRAGSGSGEWLSLQIGLRGASAHWSGSEEPSFEITGADGTRAWYGGLYAYDAEGRVLESRMELDESGQGWRLLVKVRGAHYPVVVDPLVQQQLLSSSDGYRNDYFGAAVALSSDGNTALIGAYGKMIGSNNAQGAAYVFIRSGGVWSQQQKLTASDGTTFDQFGISVALSSDGNTALVGANGNQGAAYVFTRSGGVWNQQQKLTASDGAGGSFGISVALSSDGNTALVGAYGKTVDSNSAQGAAYIFTRSGGVWSQQQSLTASDGTTIDQFGYSVALSSDGNTALIGAFSKTVGSNSNQGAAYVFIRSGGVWSQQQSLTASAGAANDRFGRAVVLSSDGNTAIVGAAGNQGAAYIFTRSGGVWNQQQKLTAFDGAGGSFGVAVALSSDGNTAIVGASSKTVGSINEQGAAYVFIRSGGIWSQQLTRLTAADGTTFDAFGISVALSSDGNTALVGADFKRINTVPQGGVYSFSQMKINGVTLTSSPNPSTFGQSVTFTATVSPITATGTLAFTEGSTTLATGTLASGVVTFSTSSLGVGSHLISATYGGISSNTLTQVINQASTTLTLTSAPNPSTFGQSVTFTATVAPVAASGTVTFTEGASVLGTGTVASGVVTFSTSSLSPGSHLISATYGGNGNYSGSSSNMITQVINQASTTLTLTSAPNPSTLGQSVIFTATVSPIGASGTVTFSEGANILGTGTISNGVATFSTTSLTAGLHVISATYGGDSTYPGSSSNSLTQAVQTSCDPLVVTNGALDTEDCGTFREAIIWANALIPTQNVTITVTPDYIGVASPLPALTNTGSYTLTVSAPCNADPTNGGRGVPFTYLNGGTAVGLTLGDRVVLRGFKVTGFSSYGVVMSGSYSSVSCSRIGTEDGTTAAALNSGGGVSITGSNNTLGGAAALDGVQISGNGGTGLSVTGGGKVSLQNVWIGLAKDGVTALSNGRGVQVASGGHIYFGRGNRLHD
jgi:hypothetical protein